MGAFVFDIDFQRATLRLCMIDDLFCMRVMDYVEPSFFTSPALGWVHKVFKAHWDTYGLPCTDVPLRGALRHASETDLPQWQSEIDRILSLGMVPEGAYIRHELQEFCRRNVFAQAHQESAQQFGADADKAYDIMAKAQDRIQRISFDDIDRQWFFEELDDRQRARWHAQLTGNNRPLSTGIPDLDKKTDGGNHRGELWCVLAYAKRCKTTWLINQGFNALRMLQEPVLHIILEGQGKQIAARYDSCFAAADYGELKRGRIDQSAFAAMRAEYEHYRNLLVIRTINNWDATVLDIQSELKEVRVNGFNPRLLIVDYMDLLRSRNKGTTLETQHQIDAARDLKRLINDEDLSGWSAWQAQRPKPDAHTREHVLTSGNVADAYAKVRIVDAYGSLNATNQEMRDGEMRLYWEEHRDHAVNVCYRISNDLDIMRMATEVIGIVTDEAAEATS